MKYDFKAWILAAGMRALRTFAQSCAGFLVGEGVGILDVDWKAAVSVSAVAAIASLLTSIAGLPEVELKKRLEDVEEDIEDEE